MESPLESGKKNVGFASNLFLARGGGTSLKQKRKGDEGKRERGLWEICSGRYKKIPSREKSNRVGVQVPRGV